MDSFDIDDGFSFFTASDAQQLTSTAESAGAPTTSDASGGDGFDLDFGDWGSTTADASGAPQPCNDTAPLATTECSGGFTDVTQGGGGGFDFSWEEQPDAQQVFPDVSTTNNAPPTPANGTQQATDTILMTTAPLPVVAAQSHPPSTLLMQQQEEPPAKKHRGDMPPPSPLPPRQAVISKPVAHQAPSPSSLPQQSNQQLKSTNALPPPPPRQPQAAVKTIQQQSISKKAVQDLLSESDELVRDVCGAPVVQLKVTDAAFRSAMTSAKQRAETEAQALANRAADLFKIALVCLDRLGPNPHIAAMLGGHALHASTPVVHLVDALQERLSEKMRSVMVVDQ